MRVGDLGAPELILCVLALVLVFGASKLGDIGGALGKSVREFKRAQQADDGGNVEGFAGAATAAAPPTSRPAVAEHRPMDAPSIAKRSGADGTARPGDGR